MEWKPYYRHELELPEAQGYLKELFTETSKNKDLDDLVDRGVILSFPHTALRYAGPIQSQVVSSLYRVGVEHVIALGVLHAWGHKLSANLYQQAMDDREISNRRLEAFSSLAGAFTPVDSFQETPFGKVPLGPFPSKEMDRVRLDVEGMLAPEFSLDTFCALLRYYATFHKLDPLRVLPVYIGMTRDPITGSFDVASGIASSIRGISGANTAIVATGDLVHYGTAYSAKERMAGMPSTIEELEGVFTREVQYTLDVSLIDKNYEEAFQHSDRVLKNDQRYLLPVLAELLPKKASYRILSFQLSNYAPILKVAEPCVVASSLVAYIPTKEGKP